VGALANRSESILGSPHLACWRRRFALGSFWVGSSRPCPASWSTARRALRGLELGSVSHPAIIATNSIANNFVTEVEEARGPSVDAACNTKTKLVEAKLEMVCAAGLFHRGAAVSGVRWIDSRGGLLAR
jgi:hypothetical protein